MKLYILWFLISFLLIVLEPMMPGLVIIWFGLGALFAGVAAILGAGFYIQLIVFAVSSVAFLVFIRKLVVKDEETRQKVGAERLVGRIGRVIKEIPADDFGMIKVMGEEWRATSHEYCGNGDSVIIRAIDGTHLIVEKINK